MKCPVAPIDGMKPDVVVKELDEAISVLEKEEALPFLKFAPTDIVDTPWAMPNITEPKKKGKNAGTGSYLVRAAQNLWK